MPRPRIDHAHAKSVLALVVLSLSGASAAIAGCFTLKDDAPVPGQDAGGDADAPSVDAGPTSADFFVDPTGALDGSFTTITAALAAASASNAQTRTVHVAPGTYRDEPFPLVVRGVSLEGAGSSADGGTTIIGTGPTTISPGPDSDHDGAVAATILAGDPVKTTRIAHVAILPSNVPQTFEGLEAVVCDQGNAAPEAGAPNSVIDDVVIDGYEAAIHVIATAPGAGCSVILTGSELRHGYFGVIAQGSSIEAGAPVAYASVHLGDGTDAGSNDFDHLHIASGPHYGYGAGLRTHDDVIDITVSGNRFSSSDNGVSLETAFRDAGAGVRIEGNDFGFLQVSGVGMTGPVLVDSLTNNVFHDIALTQFGNGFPGTGLIVNTGTNPAVSLATIRSARGNRFVGNELGIEIRVELGGAPATPDLGRFYDFGTVQSPGGNVFACNSTDHLVSDPVWSSYGGDVFISFAGSDASVPFSFVGNAWDHAPPTSVVWDGGLANVPEAGVDLLTRGAAVDDFDPHAADVDCGAHHTPGP